LETGEAAAARFPTPMIAGGEGDVGGKLEGVQANL